jgi:hypothetical protein
MSKKVDFSEALESLKQFLKSDKKDDKQKGLLFPLFKILFGKSFKTFSNTDFPDGYVEGKLILLVKNDDYQWLEGFFQSLHFHKKYGFDYHTLIIVAHNYVGIWSLENLPEYAFILAKTADVAKVPPLIGVENARKIKQAQAIEIKNAAIYWLEPQNLVGDIFNGAKNLTEETYQIKKILSQLPPNRLPINPTNFLAVISKLQSFFKQSLDSIYTFYTIIYYWDITSKAILIEKEVFLVGFYGNRQSDDIRIEISDFIAFKSLIETHYMVVNESMGLTIDTYFGLANKVLASFAPHFIQTHTEFLLCKFAARFAQLQVSVLQKDNFILLDPNAISGNTVVAWKTKLKHKIISDLSIENLKIFNLRLKSDPFCFQTGYTIVPAIDEEKGINFLEVPASVYLNKLVSASAKNNQPIAKPFIIFSDLTQSICAENQNAISNVDIHASIVKLTQTNDIKDFYLNYLGQILLVCKTQHQKIALQIKKGDGSSFVLLFTPVDWLIPNPFFEKFKLLWDRHFEFKVGFVVNGNEFLNLKEKLPIAFTIWEYQPKDNRTNEMKVKDFTQLTKEKLEINWEALNDNDFDLLLKNFTQNKKESVIDELCFTFKSKSLKSKRKYS